MMVMIKTWALCESLTVSALIIDIKHIVKLVNFYTCIRSFEDLENIKRLHSATSESIPSVQLTIWSTAVTTQHIKNAVWVRGVSHVLLFQAQLQGLIRAIKNVKVLLYVQSCEF